jgi:hypothetical protein
MNSQNINDTMRHVSALLLTCGLIAAVIAAASAYALSS